MCLFPVKVYSNAACEETVYNTMNGTAVDNFPDKISLMPTWGEAD